MGPQIAISPATSCRWNQGWTFGWSWRAQTDVSTSSDILRLGKLSRSTHFLDRLGRQVRPIHPEQLFPVPAGHELLQGSDDRLGVRTSAQQSLSIIKEVRG